jgi:hypothetical protein
LNSLSPQYHRAVRNAVDARGGVERGGERSWRASREGRVTRLFLPVFQEHLSLLFGGVRWGSPHSATDPMNAARYDKHVRRVSFQKFS